MRLKGIFYVRFQGAWLCFNCQLLIAKLHAYGLNFPSLKLIQSYFRQSEIENAHHNSVSFMQKIVIKGVPQGSILGSIFFNNHMWCVAPFGTTCIILKM